MLTVIAGVLLIVVGLFAILLQRLYSAVPLREVKRLSVKGEKMAKVVYRPLSYGTSLRILLWSVSILSLAGGLTLLSVNINQWETLAVIAAVLVLGFIILPSVSLTRFSALLAVHAAPTTEWLLRYLSPILDRVAKLVSRFRSVPTHSGLYEKDDLLALLEQQTQQPDNRIDESEISLLHSAMLFKDGRVSEVVTHHSMSKLLSTGDSVGPVLLDELFKSDEPYFAVYRGSKENIVGILSMKEIAEVKPEGHVADYMKTSLCYVNDDFSLTEAVHAMLTTGQLAALVINNFGDHVGIINLGDLVDKLFGAESTERAGSEIAYTNRESVAQYRPGGAKPSVEAVELSDDTTSLGEPEVIE